MIYGTEGTPAVFTGLATQIVYGGCDHDTADFYSKASGTTTADANPDPQKANIRQRPLRVSGLRLATGQSQASDKAGGQATKTKGQVGAG